MMPSREGVIVGMMDGKEELGMLGTEEVEPDAMVVDAFEKRGSAEELAELAGRVGIELALPTNEVKLEDEGIG